jgi:predicted HicB family RNase H-like nuclease
MGNIKYSDEDKIYYGKIIGLKKGSISYEGDTIASLAVDLLTLLMNT